MFKNFNLASIISTIIIGLFVGVVFVYANWAAPLSSPPICVAGNPGCDAPINTSNQSQIKSGNLIILGNLGIGDNSPASLLTVGNNDLFQVTSFGYVRSINGSSFSPTYSFVNDPNTGIYSGGADNLRFATNGANRLTIDSSGRVGIGTISPSNLLEVFGDIEANSILNRSQRSLLTTEYVNSDVNGNPVWTDNVLTVASTVDVNGWYWAPTVSTILQQPALGFRLRGSSDDGGVCWAHVTNLFAANITNRGYTSAYELDGTFPAGGSYSDSGAGDMFNGAGATRIFSEISSGQFYNQSGNSRVDNWGYLKPVGLDIIPSGRTVFLRGGSYDGGGGQSVYCYLDVLYATEYKPL